MEKSNKKDRFSTFVLFSFIIIMLSFFTSNTSSQPFAESEKNTLSQSKEEKHKTFIEEATPLAPINEEAFIKSRKQYSKEEEYYIRWRWERSQKLISEGSIINQKVLLAFLNTPREHFIRKMNLSRAYEDSWMPIGYGITITDPYTVCIMTEIILPDPHMKVLEIGTGSGYQAAILSNLNYYVYTIEIIKPLAYETAAIFQSLVDEYQNYKNIQMRTGDGYYGWEEEAPFDRIIVTCGIDHIPPPLIQQLALDGIMVIPVGPPGDQVLLKVTKQVSANGMITVKREALLKVSFIPFKDKHGQSYYKN